MRLFHKHSRSHFVLGLAGFGALALLACSSDDAQIDENPSSEMNEHDGETLTFYGDVLPIFEKKCLHCHQKEGIGPMDLSTYAEAKKWATSIAAQVDSLEMPPYLMKRGGDYGVFDDSEALTDDQLATILAWTKSGRAEGTVRDAEVPELPSLEGATDLALPEFTPEITGGDYAKFDEYRCFRVDVEPGTAPFISGYDVKPGNARIVHHVVGFTVDTALYGERMDELDAESPERPGWPCFGAAGDGVEPVSVPVTWAPGQGVVDFPANSGVKLGETETLVFQVHYNLADPEVIGQKDQTTVQIRFSEQEDLERQASFLLPDPLLESVFTGEPTELAPGEKSVKYTWSMTGEELFDPITLLGSIDVVGLGPHMHEYGTKMVVSLKDPDGTETVIGQTDRWDFAWQKIYQYKEFPQIQADSELTVTCEYDTRSATEPVKAGWGTRNEMCLPMLIVTLPPGLFF